MSDVASQKKHHKIYFMIGLSALISFVLAFGVAFIPFEPVQLLIIPLLLWGLWSGGFMGVSWFLSFFCEGY